MGQPDRPFKFMKGIVYIRVSSEEQVKGTSLEFQEEICRKYCSEKGIEIPKDGVFREEGASAKTADRVQFLRAVEFCRKHKGAIDAFVVAKVDRFARNTEDHFYIRKILLGYGVTLHSVTEPIGNSPVEKFFETMLAGSAEFDNAIRTQRSSDGMEQRVKQGIWPWPSPLGYQCTHAKKRGEKKTQPDPPDEKIFPIIQRGLKEYAKGMCSQIELVRLMDDWGLKKIRGKPISPQFVDAMLGKHLKFYAGILVVPRTGEEIRGRHTPMITEDEMRRIMLVRSGKANLGTRDRLNPEFPLRRTGKCVSCGASLTGSVSKGNGGAYSYYHCPKRGCPMFGKGIVKTDMEKHFMKRLAKITPGKKFLAVMNSSLMEVWRERAKHLADEVERRAGRLAELEAKKKRIYEMREDGSYTKEEFMERKEEAENLIAVEKISHSETKIDQYDIEALLVYFDRFGLNLGRQWFDLHTRPDLRLRFQKLVFPQGISYQRGEGFGTAKMGCIFEANQLFDGKKSTLVPYCVDTWNQIMRELQEWKSVAGGDCGLSSSLCGPRFFITRLLCVRRPFGNMARHTPSRPSAGRNTLTSGRPKNPSKSGDSWPPLLTKYVFYAVIYSSVFLV